MMVLPGSMQEKVKTEMCKVIIIGIVFKKKHKKNKCILGKKVYIGRTLMFFENLLTIKHFKK